MISQGGHEASPSDAPDEAGGLEGYVPHHREEFLGWMKGHVPRRKGEAGDDEPKPSVDEHS